MSYFAVSESIIRAINLNDISIKIYFGSNKLVLTIEYTDYDIINNKIIEVSIVINKLLNKPEYRIQSMGKSLSRVAVNPKQDTILYPMVKELFRRGYTNYVRNHTRYP